ncbi:MAG: hypothetical protein MUP63_03335 [Candidatus Nanohaloarchaeota archaeon QJJ-7]|nr:hypothetical protein [Candidatus Nanohaloarchaeota archaeon QJJ-7]
MAKVAVSYWEENGNPIKYETFSRIDEWAEIEILNPEVSHPELGKNGYDLFHNAKRRKGALQDHRRAQENGLTTLNSAEGAYTTIDRLSTLQRLEELGIDTPDWEYTWADDVTLGPPLVAKPRLELGEDRHDVMFYGQADYEDLPFQNGTLDYEDRRIVEEFVDPARHIKTYLIGDEVRAVELSDPLHWYGAAIEPDPEMEETVRRIGEGFGFSILEADMVERNGDRYTVDVNQTANLSGVEDAPELYEQAVRETLEN